MLDLLDTHMQKNEVDEASADTENTKLEKTAAALEEPGRGQCRMG